MIPIKNKTYIISFCSSEDKNHDYVGQATYTGNKEGCLFLFNNLSSDPGCVDFAYFAEEDIVSLVDK